MKRSNAALAYDMFDDTYSDAQLVSDKINVIVPFLDLSNLTNVAGKAVDIADYDEAEEEESVLVLPVREFANAEFKITLREPIPLYIQGDNNQYVALHEASRVCGQGDDMPSAFRDFSDSFISVFLSYTKPDSPLSSGAKKYAEFLSQLVENIEKI